MKTISTLTALSLSILIAATPALASGGSTKVYSSGLLVALFIGICAFVVLIQVAPALLTMWGMLKGALKSRNDQKLTHVRAHH